MAMVMVARLLCQGLDRQGQNDEHCVSPEIQQYGQWVMGVMIPRELVWAWGTLHDVKEYEYYFDTTLFVCSRDCS